MLRTPRQRKMLCRDCPVARVADLVGDSVSLLIMRDLVDKRRRFTDFELAFHGVSSRTLTLKLKKLEKSGLITRTPNHQLGNRVDYTVTKKGLAFDDVISAMLLYGKKYL